MSRLDKVRSASSTTVALVAALVVALGVIVWLALADRSTGDDLDAARDRLEQTDARAEAGTSAVEAARVVLGQITTYSYKDGEHDFAWLDKIADPELKKKLAPNVEALQKAIVDGQVTAKGSVLDAVPRVVDDGQVEILAFVDQAISNAADKDVQIEEQRVSMTMKRVAGDWQVERLELLSGTNAAAPTTPSTP